MQYLLTKTGSVHMRKEGAIQRVTAWQGRSKATAASQQAKCGNRTGRQSHTGNIIRIWTFRGVEAEADAPESRWLRAIPEYMPLVCMAPGAQDLLSDNPKRDIRRLPNVIGVDSLP